MDYAKLTDEQKRLRSNIVTEATRFIMVVSMNGFPVSSPFTLAIMRIATRQIEHALSLGVTANTEMNVEMLTSLLQITRDEVEFVIADLRLDV